MSIFPGLTVGKRESTCKGCVCVCLCVWWEEEGWLFSKPRTQVFFLKSRSSVYVNVSLLTTFSLHSPIPVQLPGLCSCGAVQNAVFFLPTAETNWSSK